MNASIIPVPIKIRKKPLLGTLQSFATFFKNFNYNRYFTDIDYSWAFKCLSLLLLFLLFGEFIKGIVDRSLVEPVFKFCDNNSYLIDLTLLSIFLYYFGYSLKNFYKGLVITLNSLIAIFSILLIYISIFRYNPDYHFYHFKIWSLHRIAYLDLCLLAIILRLSSYKTYRCGLNIKDRRLGLIEDAALIKEYKDLYGHGKYAKKIVGHINATVTKSSFGIGIFGSWGSGKTDFLKRLKEELQVDKKNLVFDFNPWKVKSDAIVDEFFKTLSIQLKPFNKSIVTDIKEYSKRILQTGKEVQYRLLDTLINNWAEDDTLEKKHDEINTAIKLTGRRVVVLIDDLDRLSGKEIMEVLRIVRNTANFANTFFIVGLDQEYTVKVLEGAKDFANEKEYLKKIFQLTITLPAFNKKFLISEADRLLINDATLADEAQALRLVLKRLSTDYGASINELYTVANREEIFENFIGNFRDLKRFCNSFKISYELLKGEIDISDLFVLELIKNRHIDIFNKLKSRELLDFTKDNDKFKANVDIIDKLDSNIYSVEEIAKLKEAINFLTLSTGKNQRGFLNVQNYFLYFSYQLFDQISFSEFNTLLTKEAFEMIQTINIWIESGKYNEFEKIILEQPFVGSENLYKMVVVFLSIKKDSDVWQKRVLARVSEQRNSILKQDFENSEVKFRDFLIKFSKNKEVSSLNRSTILYHFLMPFVYADQDHLIKIFKEKEEVQKIMLDILEDELKNTTKIDSSTISLLHTIYDFIDDISRQIVIYGPALEFFRQSLSKNNQFLEDYLLRLLRPTMATFNGEVEFERLVLQIFPDLDVFREKVKGLHFEKLSEATSEVLKVEIVNNIDIAVSAGTFKVQSGHKSIIEKIMKDNGVLNS